MQFYGAWPQLLVTAVEARSRWEFWSCSPAAVSVETGAYQSQPTFPRVHGLKARFKITSKTKGCRVVAWPIKNPAQRANAHCLLHLSQLECTQCHRAAWSSLLALLLLRARLCLANRPRILVEAAAVDNVVCSLTCAPLLLPHRGSKRRSHLKCRVTARLRVRRVLPPLCVVLDCNLSSWQPGN